MVNAGRRADKRKLVIRILKLCVIGVDFVHEKGNSFVVFVALD